MPIDLMLGTTDKAKINPGDYVLKLRENLEKSFDIARKRTGNTARRQKLQYDFNQKHLIYKVGDKVWYLQDKDTGKLSSPYVGPVTITKKLTDLTYQIKLEDEGRRKHKKIVHHDKLKPFYARI
jgi:hypothetical protein